MGNKKNDVEIDNKKEKTQKSSSNIKEELNCRYLIINLVFIVIAVGESRVGKDTSGL